MSFSVGIVGLPNVGKSTLFKALTRQEVDISNYPFCTINPNVGIVQVPDERLNKIAEIVNPKKVTPTIIEFVDIAGLVKGAHKGEGLGNQFLSHIREVDAILHIVRDFVDPSIKHVEEDINPQRDIEIINTELIMKDLETLDKHLEKVQQENKSGAKEKNRELETLQKIKKELNAGKLISNIGLDEKEKELIKHLNLLTIKPVIYILNIRENNDYSQLLKSLPENSLPIDLKIELECTELSPQELAEMNLKSRIDVLIKTCYKILDLVSFYTIKGGEEVRAWTIKKGAGATEAGGVVHTDFKEKFIRAEVINYKNLLEAGSWTKARSGGLIRTEGKDYPVKDGDIIEFKI
jgi:GTP-binding protein YchF